MMLYDESNIASAPWPDTAEGRFARDFLTPLVREGTAAFSSEQATFQVVELDGLMIPIAITPAGNDNSGNLSQVGRYVRFPRAGLNQLGWNPAVVAAARAAMSGLIALLEATRVDQCVFIGQWLLYRGLEPLLSEEQARRLTAFLAERFPDHALVFPAVNPMTHHTLLNSLAGSGYGFTFAGQTRMLLPYNAPVSRQARENRRRDGKLLQDSGYELLDGNEVAGCAPRLAELYRALNRGKYASNPDVLPAFYERVLRDKTMTIRMARKDGRIDGFYGYMIHGPVLFSPVFGYEMSVPQEVGLYRMLVWRLVQDALDLGLAIETGGGADQFKSMRGDAAVGRFGAFYVDHLPRHRRLGWSALQWYANGPFFQSARAYIRSFDAKAVTGFDGVPERFESPANTPALAVAALRQELDSIRSAIDEVAGLQGEERARRIAAVSEKLNNWPQPTRLVEELKERLEQVERRAREQRKAEEKKGAAASLGAAQALLLRADKRGPFSLVVGALEGASQQQLRAAAAAVLQQAAPAAVFFASVYEGRVVLLAAMAKELLAHGLAAGALVEAVAPLVGGKGGGKPELAFGGGTRPEAIPEAIASARRHLEERLAPLQRLPEV